VERETIEALRREIERNRAAMRREKKTCPDADQREWELQVLELEKFCNDQTS